MAELRCWALNQQVASSGLKHPNDVASLNKSSKESWQMHLLPSSSRQSASCSPRITSVTVFKPPQTITVPE